MATGLFPATDITAGYANGDDGWEATMNTNLRQIGYLLQCAVENMDQTTPPTLGAGDVGNRYIVAASAIDDWSGEDDNIAIWWQAGEDSSAEWKFVDMGTDQEGFRIWNKDDSRMYVWSGTAWIAKDLITVNLASASNTALGNSHPIGNKLGIYTVPRALTLVGVKFVASAITAGAGAGVQADLYDETGTPATVLSGSPFTLAAAVTPVDGTISTSAFAANKVLGLRCVTASDADATNVTVTLSFIEA